MAEDPQAVIGRMEAYEKNREVNNNSLVVTAVESVGQGVLWGAATNFLIGMAQKHLFGRRG